MTHRVETLADNVQTSSLLHRGAKHTDVLEHALEAVRQLCLDVHRSGGTHVSIEGVLEVMRRETGADDVT